MFSIRPQLPTPFRGYSVLLPFGFDHTSSWAMISIAWCKLLFERHDFILHFYVDSVSAEVRGAGD